MKFSAFSPFTLSSLLVSGLAAPTVSASQRDLVSAQVEKRVVGETYSHVMVIMKEFVAEVKTHWCHEYVNPLHNPFFIAGLAQLLDATISLPAAPAALSETEKFAIFNSVQSSCRQIISAISTAIVSITKLEVVA